MSRINDVIAELCLAGVEFRAVADCVVRPQGIRWAEHVGEQFQYIDLTSVDRVTHKIVDTATITSENAPSRAQQIVRAGDVIFGTTRPTLKRYAVIPPDYDGQICSTGFCVLRPDTKVVLTNYLFHMLGTGDFHEYIERNERGASYPAISDTLVKRYRIPVPPLEVQRVVVRVLDGFTKLEAELEVELEAEVEARRQQYEHYRDSLLAFTESATIPWMTLSEIGKLVRGNGMPKSDFVDSGVGCIHYGQIYTYYGTWATETISFVAAETARKLAKVDPGDLIIANTSENLDDVCKAVAWLGNTQIVTGGHATVLKHRQDPKYLSYYFQTPCFFGEKKKRATGTKVIDVSAKSLASIRIPLPPLEVQNDIAAILDKFGALVNDLLTGLPAELNARRQQYEYYRDRLLTFSEAV